MKGVAAKAMKVEGNNLVKKGKNYWLHNLAWCDWCDSDYDGAQLWINLSVPTHTHTHVQRVNTTSVIVSDGQKSFQSGGDPVIPHSPGLRPSSKLGSSCSRRSIKNVHFKKWTSDHQIHDININDK